MAKLNHFARGTRREKRAEGEITALLVDPHTSAWQDVGKGFQLHVARAMSLNMIANAKRDPQHEMRRVKPGAFGIFGGRDRLGGQRVTEGHERIPAIAKRAHAVTFLLKWLATHEAEDRAARGSADAEHRPVGDEPLAVCWNLVGFLFFVLVLGDLGRLFLTGNWFT